MCLFSVLGPWAFGKKISPDHSQLCMKLLLTPRLAGGWSGKELNEILLIDKFQRKNFDTIENIDGCTDGTMRGPGGFVPPKPKKLANIVQENWHKISLVYLWIDKLCQNPPPTSFGFFRAGAATGWVYQKGVCGF